MTKCAAMLILAILIVQTGCVAKNKLEIVKSYKRSRRAINLRSSYCTQTHPLCWTAASSQPPFIRDVAHPGKLSPPQTCLHVHQPPNPPNSPPQISFPFLQPPKRLSSVLYAFIRMTLPHSSSLSAQHIPSAPPASTAISK